MGTPITWRNVEAVNPAAAAQPMQAATGTINGAFDIFNKIIQQRQAVDAGNVQVMDEVSKQNYLDRLQQETTPEGMAALVASGELDAARQALSAAARNSVRPAAEARTASLVNTQRGTEKFGWERAGETRAVNVDTRAEATAAQAALLAPLTRAATTASTEVSNQQVLTGQQGIRRSEQEIRESAQRIDASKLQEDRLRDESALKEYERRQVAYKDTVERLGANAKGVIGTPDGMKALTESVAKVVKDPKGLADAMTFVTQALNSNPDFARLPTDVIEALVLSKADQYGQTWGDWDSTLVKHLATGMTAALKSSAPRMLAHEAQKGELTDLVQRQRIILSNAEALAHPQAVAQMNDMARSAEEKKLAEAAKAAAAPAVPAAPAPVALLKPAADPMEQRVAQESSDLNRGLRNDLSPDVRAYMAEKSRRQRHDARIAAELESAQAREKERALAVARSKEQLRGAGK